MANLFCTNIIRDTRDKYELTLRVELFRSKGIFDIVSSDLCLIWLGVADGHR